MLPLIPYFEHYLLMEKSHVSKKNISSSRIIDYFQSILFVFLHEFLGTWPIHCLILKYCQENKNYISSKLGPQISVKELPYSSLFQVKLIGVIVKLLSHRQLLGFWLSLRD